MMTLATYEPACSSETFAPHCAGPSSLRLAITRVAPCGGTHAAYVSVRYDGGGGVGLRRERVASHITSRGPRASILAPAGTWQRGARCGFGTDAAGSAAAAGIAVKASVRSPSVAVARGL